VSLSKSLPESKACGRANFKFDFQPRRKDLMRSTLHSKSCRGSGADNEVQHDKTKSESLGEVELLSLEIHVTPSKCVKGRGANFAPIRLHTTTITRILWDTYIHSRVRLLPSLSATPFIHQRNLTHRASTLTKLNAPPPYLHRNLFQTLHPWPTRTTIPKRSQTS
jgi:hypothetical protein